MTLCEFEKTHIKITHPPLFLTKMDDGTIELQTKDKLISSYKHLKSTYKDEKGDIVKSCFVKYTGGRYSYHLP